MNLARSDAFKILPTNSLGSSELDKEDEKSVTKLYKNIPGYEFIGNFEDYITDSEIHSQRLLIFNSLDIIVLLNSMPKTQFYNSQIISEFLLNLCEELEIKRKIIEHGFLKKLLEFYNETSNFSCKINFSQTIARLLINTNFLVSKIQAEQCVFCLIDSIRKFEKSSELPKFNELFNFEICMSLSYLASIHENLNNLYFLYVLNNKSKDY